MEALKGQENTRLSIGASESVTDWCVLPALAQFKQRFPNICCELLSDVVPDTMTLDGPDVLVREACAPEVASCYVERLVTNPWRLFGSDQYIAEQDLPSTVDEFSEHRFVVAGDQVATYPAMKQLMQHIPASNIALRCSSFSAMRHAISNGLGLGLLPAITGWEANTLTPAPISWHEDTGDIWMLVRSKHQNDPIVAALVDCLRAQR